jgi:site-specific DNA-cytosine methylase
MKVLIACEFSGVVREAFQKLGHHAVSVDLLPTEKSSPWHFQMSIEDFLNEYICDYDLMIAHPPCTYLASSGARWFKDRELEQIQALNFVYWLSELDIPKIAIENPIGILSTQWRKPDQIIQPWMFGHGETKATCLWLKNLPKLQPTNIVSGREGRVWKESPGPNRWKNRSRTYQGIADAMAEQWGLCSSLSENQTTEANKK